MKLSAVRGCFGWVRILNNNGNKVIFSIKYQGMTLWMLSGNEYDLKNEVDQI
jgi:hypothetical protein